MSAPSRLIEPGVRLHQADDHVERRGLAGTVRAQQSDSLAAPQLDRDVPHHRALLVGLARRRARPAPRRLATTRSSAAARVSDARCRSLRRTLRLARSRSAGWPPGLSGDLLVGSSFGITRPCTRSPVPASRREMPVFMLTSASEPSSWFCPRVMRTCPPAGRCRCRAHRPRGRRSRCRSTVRTETLPNASTFCSLPDAASGSSAVRLCRHRRRPAGGGGASLV